MIDPDDMPPPHPEDDHEALEREHAARVEAARIHHAREAQLPVPGALAASLSDVLAGLRVAVVDPAHEARVQAERRAREARERRALRALADARDLPPDELLRAVALDQSPEATSAMRLAREVDAWRGRRRLGALRVLSGVPGVGKSAALAWCCMWDRPGEAREREALWLHASALAPRTGWSESAVLWERWQRVPLLCVDDLGVETCDPAVVQGLLLTRWDAGLVTLASTNAMWPEWSARYLGGSAGDRLRDRLKSAQWHDGAPSGLRAFVTAEGSSLRGAGAQLLHSGQ